jgi:hypothetical protein
VSSLDAPGFVLDSVTALDPIGHCRLRYAVLDVSVGESGSDPTF